MPQTTRNSRLITASAAKIFAALTEPRAVETWQAPGNMTARVHHFDLREGGSYTMSLFYPQNEMNIGKTSVREDKFSSTFVVLDPPHKIIQEVEFETDDPQFSGKMIMEVTLEPAREGTKVTFFFNNIPPGIKPEDNEAGTLSSLEKLALYVEE